MSMDDRLFIQAKKKPTRTQFTLADAVKMEIVGLIESPEGYTGKLRIHPFWELMYILHGTGTISYKGQRHPFTSGDLLLAQPFQIHQVQMVEKGRLEMLYIGFTLDLSPPVRRERIPLRLYEEGENPFVRERLKEIASELKAGKNGSGLHIGSLLQILFFVVESLNRPDKSDGTREGAILAAKAKRYLETNICRQLSIEELAAYLCVSPHYCIDIFSKAFGISPKRYHASLRMTLAGTMLEDRSNNMRISEIASFLGFSSIHHFSKRFKEYHRISPSQYRSRSG
jgi:AraC-like DNA-binding protein/mannose-6-phosphate isomerase-like protein (cupin superfamily)